MQCYSVIKVSDVLNKERTLRSLKCILQSERNQPEKLTYYMVLTVSHTEKGKTIETVKRSVAARIWGGKDILVERQAFVGQWTYSV